MDYLKDTELNVLEERLLAAKSESKNIRIGNIVINKGALDVFKNTAFLDESQRHVPYVSGFITSKGEVIPTYLFQGAGRTSLSEKRYALSCSSMSEYDAGRFSIDRKEWISSAKSNGFPSLLIALDEYNTEESNCISCITKAVIQDLTFTIIPLSSFDSTTKDLITVYNGLTGKSKKFFSMGEYLVITKSVYDFSGKKLSETKSLELSKSDVAEATSLAGLVGNSEIRWDHQNLLRKIFEPLKDEYVIHPK